MTELFSPLTLPCGLTLRNRVALAPLTNTMSELDGSVSDADRRFLGMRSRGGFGLVSTCAAFVSPRGKAWEGQLGVADDAHVPGLRTLADTIREGGAASVVQLHHAGAKATLAPTKLSTADGEGVQGASPADLAEVTADFVAAAERVRAAGFDGVEVHGANGYLFTQFLAPGTNPREDAYGGDLRNRARLLLETVTAVREAMPADFAVGVRLSPVDYYERRGLVLRDSVEVGRWLAELGVDWVHLSSGNVLDAPQHEPEEVPPVRAFREALPEELPIFGVGGMWTREDADAALQIGADVAVVGRAGMAHADWPSAIRGVFEPVRPPWQRGHLAEQGLSERFVSYIANFRGILAD